MSSLPRLERSEGELRLGLAVRAGRTTAYESFQSGALRVRMPRDHDGFEANVLNTAGGLTGGDSLRLVFTAAAGTTSTIASQACEKIYKSTGDDALVRTDITLEGDASLDYLPQPTILFDRARLRRETHVHVGEASRVLALEAGIFGRTAMGEDFRHGGLRDDWRVTRAGRLVFADALALTGKTLAELRTPWGLAQARAYATILYAAPDAEARLGAMREALTGIDGAASAWNGVLLTRLVVSDGYALGQALAHVLRAFRQCPLPRSWSI